MTTDKTYHAHSTSISASTLKSTPRTFPFIHPIEGYFELLKYSHSSKKVLLSYEVPSISRYGAFYNPNIQRFIPLASGCGATEPFCRYASQTSQEIYRTTSTRTPSTTNVCGTKKRIPKTLVGEKALVPHYSNQYSHEDKTLGCLPDTYVG